MQLQPEADFEQILKAVLALPPEKLLLLQSEIDRELKNEKGSSNLLSLLLNGPVATKKEIQTILNNRKAINRWRTKPL